MEIVCGRDVIDQLTIEQIDVALFQSPMELGCGRDSHGARAARAELEVAVFT